MCGCPEYCLAVLSFIHINVWVFLLKSSMVKKKVFTLGTDIRQLNIFFLQVIFDIVLYSSTVVVSLGLNYVNWLFKIMKIFALQENG